MPCILQLPLFNKEADECENEFERWIFVLKNMETLTRLPWAAQNAVFKKLEDITDEAALSKLERMKYEEGLRKYRDTISVLQGAREEGYAEGYAEAYAKAYVEGYVEGRNQRSFEIAKKMLLGGMDEATVMEMTGLTKEDINQIKL